VGVRVLQSTTARQCSVCPLFLSLSRSTPFPLPLSFSHVLSLPLSASLDGRSPSLRRFAARHKPGPGLREPGPRGPRGQRRRSRTRERERSTAGTPARDTASSRLCARPRARMPLRPSAGAAVSPFRRPNRGPVVAPRPCRNPPPGRRRGARFRRGAEARLQGPVENRERRRAGESESESKSKSERDRERGREGEREREREARACRASFAGAHGPAQARAARLTPNGPSPARPGPEPAGSLEWLRGPGRCRCDAPDPRRAPPVPISGVHPYNPSLTQSILPFT
jgi:hypothetical protein